MGALNGQSLAHNRFEQGTNSRSCCNFHVNKIMHAVRQCILWFYMFIRSKYAVIISVIEKFRIYVSTFFY